MIFIASERQEYGDPMTNVQLLELILGVVALAVLAWLVYHRRHLK